MIHFYQSLPERLQMDNHNMGLDIHRTGFQPTALKIGGLLPAHYGFEPQFPRRKGVDS